MKSVRVVLIEDHHLVRAGVRSLLESLSNVEVVAEASDGLVALELIDTHRPDLVLMDISLQGLGGLEAAARALRKHPQLRIIMLSMHANEEYVWQALHHGVSGYLLKNAGPNELELAISAVMQGNSYLSPAISRQVADYIRRAGEGSSLDRLTARQREILLLIATGNSTQQIADKLNLTVKTVGTHRAQLMERLGIYDVAGLVRYAIRTGLIAPNE